MNRRVMNIVMALVAGCGALLAGYILLRPMRQDGAQPRLPALAALPAACAFGEDGGAPDDAPRARRITFGARQTQPWPGQPVRVADWSAARKALLLVTQGKTANTEQMWLYAPDSGAREAVGERAAGLALPSWSRRLARVTEQRDAELDATVLSQPRIPGQAVPAFNSPVVRVIERPGTAQLLAFGSQQAVLMDTAGNGPCTLPINWRADGDLPIVSAAWSGDGRFLALLLLADAGRLGPTELRLLDMELGQWRSAPPVAGAVSGMLWRPGSHDLLLTVSHIDTPDKLDSLAALDAESLQPVTLAGAPELFAPGYWGLAFRDDGAALYAACALPDATGVVTSGELCSWEVSAP